ILVRRLILGSPLLSLTQRLRPDARELVGHVRGSIRGAPPQHRRVDLSLWDHLLKQVFRINSQSLSVDPVAAELISNRAGGDGRLLVVIGSSDSEGSLVEQTPGLVRHLPRRLLAP